MSLSLGWPSEFVTECNVHLNSVQVDHRKKDYKFGFGLVVGE